MTTEFLKINKTAPLSFGQDISINHKVIFEDHLAMSDLSSQQKRKRTMNCCQVSFRGNISTILSIALEVRPMVIRPHSLTGSRISTRPGTDLAGVIKRDNIMKTMSLIAIMLGILCSCQDKEDAVCTEHVCSCETTCFKIPPPSQIMFTPKSSKMENDSAQYRKVAERWNEDLIRLME